MTQLEKFIERIRKWAQEHPNRVAVVLITASKDGALESWTFLGDAKVEGKQEQESKDVV